MPQEHAGLVLSWSVCEGGSCLVSPDRLEGSHGSRVGASGRTFETPVPLRDLSEVISY